jgi:RHS repeat-associated protein
MSNPLIATPKDSTTAFSGVPLLESVNDTSKAVQQGDWLEAGLGAAGTALDALGMAMDPFGAIFSAGVGWLIEHVGPLSDALDELTGDADAIAAHAETWRNVAKAVTDASTDLNNLVQNDTTQWLGDAADTYRSRTTDTANLILAAATAADGTAGGVEMAGTVVGAVRTLVRDIIAELVGHLISWALQVLFTLGIGMLWVVPQVVRAVASTAMKIATITQKLVRSIAKLVPMLKKLGNSFGDAAKNLKKLKRDNPKGGGTSPSSDKGGPNSKGPGNKGPGNNGAGDKGPNNNGGDHGPNPPGTTPNSDKSPPPPKNNAPTPPPKDGTPPPADKTPPPPNNTPPPQKAPPTNNGGGKTTPSNNKPEPPRDRSVPGDDRNCKSDPVDVASGEVLFTEVDLELRGALPLIVERTHVSSYRAGRLLGASWSSTLDQRLEFDDTDACYFSPDGMILVYPLPGRGGQSLPVEGPRSPLTHKADDTYEITDPASNRTLHFGRVRDTTARLEAITDGNDRRIDIEYDDSGAPVLMRHVNGNVVHLRTEHGRLAEIRLAGILGALDVAVMTYHYDERGRLTEVVNSSGLPMRFDYDAEGRMTGWQDRNGVWYRYIYDAEGRCVRTVGADGFFDGTFEYDRENRVTRYTDSLGHTTAIHLNEANQTVREVDPLGNATAFEWDRYDRLLASTDPLGRTTRYEYDDYGNQSAITYPDGSKQLMVHDGVNRPVTIVDPDGAVWHREYDDRGNLLASVDPTGARTEFDYDAAGTLTVRIDPLGNTTTYHNDPAGRPVLVTDPTGATTQYTYDDFGRATSITDPLGGVLRLQWTVEGRVARVIHPDGAVEQWKYDAEGNIRERVDALGQVSRMEVAAFDLMVGRTRPDGTRQAYGYDTQLRPTSTTNEQGLNWRYEYDPAGNLVREHDFNGRTLSYTHNPAGEVVEQTDGAGQTVRLVHDALGRVVRKQHGDAVTTFDYDQVGRLVHARNADAELIRTYDPLGRVLTETVNGRTVSSVYDAAGRRVRRRTPSGAESVWEYDAAGRPVVLRAAGHRMHFKYDLAGQEIERQIGAQVRLASAWDANHQLSSRTLVAGSHVAQRRAYTYRPDGFLVAEEDQLAGPRRFDVDRLGRVSAVHGNGWSEQYTYDPAGNIVHATWPAPPQVDSAGPRHYAGTLLQQAGNVRYDHDSQGRVVRRQRTLPSGQTETWLYTWGPEDRLLGVVTPDGQRWRYRYDPLGRRIAKQLLGPDGVSVLQQIDFAWDDNLLVEQVVNGGRATVWDWEPDGHRAVAQTERVAVAQQWVDEQFYAVVTDLVGTPAELVDAEGTVAWHARSSLWGAPVHVRAGVAGTPLRFPGQYFDPETRLHYNLNRYYDPDTGRYLSMDPLGLEAGTRPQSYVTNPTAWIDPLGLMESTCGKRKRDEDPPDGGRQLRKPRKDPDDGKRRSGRNKPDGQGQDHDPNKAGSSKKNGPDEPWDGRSRPPWDDGKKDEVLDKMEKDGNGNFKCPKCKQFNPPGNIQIDHKMNYRDYIDLNAGGAAAPTNAEARAASNDIRNLQGLCSSCNASKGGPKGTRA